MGVGDFLREEEAVARHSVYGVEVRFGEDARGAETRIRRHRERDLVGLEVFPGEGAPTRG